MQIRWRNLRHPKDKALMGNADDIICVQIKCALLFGRNFLQESCNMRQYSVRSILENRGMLFQISGITRQKKYEDKPELC